MTLTRRELLLTTCAAFAGGMGGAALPTKRCSLVQVVSSKEWRQPLVLRSAAEMQELYPSPKCLHILLNPGDPLPRGRYAVVGTTTWGPHFAAPVLFVDEKNGLWWPPRLDFKWQPGQIVTVVGHA